MSDRGRGGEYRGQARGGGGRGYRGGPADRGAYRRPEGGSRGGRGDRGGYYQDNRGGRGRGQFEPPYRDSQAQGFLDQPPPSAYRQPSGPFRQPAPPGMRGSRGGAMARGDPRPAQAWQQSAPPVQAMMPMPVTQFPEIKPDEEVSTTEMPTERGDAPSSPPKGATAAARQKKKHPIQMDALSTQMSSLALRGSLKTPARPDAGGQVGNRVQVEVNCWDLTFADKTVFMYDVEAVAVYRLDLKTQQKTEMRLPPKEKRALLQKVVESLPKDAIYDGGRIIYKMTRIEGVTSAGVKRTVEVPDPLKRDHMLLEYRIMEVQTTSTRALSDYVLNVNSSSLDMPQESIRLMDCIFKSICQSEFISLGRAALFYPKPVKEVADKLFTIHKGFILSVRPQWKVRLNVDMTCKAFFTAGNLADVLYDKYGDNMARCIPQMAADLKRIRVETDPFYKNDDGNSFSRRFTIHGLSKEPCGSLLIEDLNKTVFEYFREHHGITLKYPELPAVKVNQKRDVYIPMELLKILPFQAPNAKKGDVASEVIRCAAIRPQERFAELQTLVSNIVRSAHNLKRDFNIQLGQNPVRVNARVLPTPKAEFGGQMQPLGRGKWQTPSFCKPAVSHQSGTINWAILCVPPDRNSRRDESMLANQLPQVAQRFGLRFGTPNCFQTPPAHLRRQLEELHAKGVDLAVLILYDDFNYPAIKRFSDLFLGIRTQCVRGRTLTKPNVLPNLLLKINGKLGGINWRIPDLLRNPKELIMVVGADVTHPAPTQTQELRKSVAAVLGSITPDLMRYAVVVRQQATTARGDKATREIIDSMDVIMSKLLQLFYRRNNDRFPDRIIFYRDGVSEGQFSNVLVEELSAIQRACSDLKQGYEPAVTYIVVQKRHHIRFKPTDPRARNVDPGTVVDSEITHKREFDFYLCSQEGIQGTSKPAHYHVLYDDSNWVSDALQIFTFFLCHGYMRCSRSVSYPAPTFYSHLAAFRARDWLDGIDQPASLLKDSVFTVHDTQVEGMFFL